MYTIGRFKWRDLLDLPTRYEVLWLNPSLTLLTARDSLQGGHFVLNLTLPKDYPFKPPILNFATKIYHPNVSNDGKGSMCLGILRPDEWKPPNRILSVLQMVQNILKEPLPDDAVEPSIADQYKTDYKAFEKTAKDWVKKFAGAK